MCQIYCCKDKSMFLTVPVNHLPFPCISISLGCSDAAHVYMNPWQVLSPVHTLRWSLCLSGGCSEGDCVSLASTCPVFLGWLWRGDGESCASFAFGGVCAAFAVSWNILVREHLWYFLSGAACLPLEGPKRHQKALIFKAFLGKGITILCFLPYSGQSLHPTKTNRSPDELPVFSIWQSLISLPNVGASFHGWPSRRDGFSVISDD